MKTVGWWISVPVLAGQTSLSFAGSSYIKYRVTGGNKSGDMKLSLRIRTMQSQGVIMYTRADPCTMLKVRANSYLLNTILEFCCTGIIGIWCHCPKKYNRMLKCSMCKCFLRDGAVWCSGHQFDSVYFEAYVDIYFTTVSFANTHQQ